MRAGLPESGVAVSAVRYVGPFTEWPCSGCGAVMQSRGPAPEGLRCMACVRRDEEVLRLAGDLELTLCDLVNARREGHEADEDAALRDMRALLDDMLARLSAKKGGR